jgi:thiol-disulfide isomerase/thioredoxin
LRPWIVPLFALCVVLAGSQIVRAETPEGASVERSVAMGTAGVLRPSKVEVQMLPAKVFKRIEGKTALLYFAPACPHCQDVMPVVNQLAKTNSIAWLGVASSRSTQAEIDAFILEYTVDFPVIRDDADASFANAVGARSTPSVYVVRPRQEPKKDDPKNAVDLIDMFAPFGRGMAGIFNIRANLSTPFVHFDVYQGPQVCGTCHQQEMRSWAITHHASAYRTLYTRDRAQDMQCVGCHVTGMNEPSGFVLGDHGSPLRDVSCESCHGMGGPHNPLAGEKVDAVSGCVDCHDADHSVAFSPQKGLPHIDHFAANELTDAEVRNRIIAIGNGEAPRPLLAFPEGPTVGQAACKNCHKDSHKQWRKSDHAHAMTRLEPSEAERVECVRCHATPTAFGPGTGTTISSYRTEEAVGCESCHGAGAAHVESPTKENIVGLGSSCPECVIEAVCTSCHTPKWDPGWELKKRLEAVRH